jgi:hypothetical protein
LLLLLVPLLGVLLTSAAAAAAAAAEGSRPLLLPQDCRLAWLLLLLQLSRLAVRDSGLL